MSSPKKKPLHPQFTFANRKPLNYYEPRKEKFGGPSARDAQDPRRVVRTFAINNAPRWAYENRNNKKKNQDQNSEEDASSSAAAAAAKITDATNLHDRFKAVEGNPRSADFCHSSEPRFEWERYEKLEEMRRKREDKKSATQQNSRNKLNVEAALEATRARAMAPVMRPPSEMEIKRSKQMEAPLTEEQKKSRLAAEEYGSISHSVRQSRRGDFSTGGERFPTEESIRAKTRRMKIEINENRQKNRERQMPPPLVVNYAAVEPKVASPVIAPLSSHEKKNFERNNGHNNSNSNNRRRLTDEELKEAREKDYSFRAFQQLDFLSTSKRSQNALINLKSPISANTPLMYDTGNFYNSRSMRALLCDTDGMVIKNCEAMSPSQSQNKNSFSSSSSSPNQSSSSSSGVKKSSVPLRLLKSIGRSNNSEDRFQTPQRHNFVLDESFQQQQNQQEQQEQNQAEDYQQRYLASMPSPPTSEYLSSEMLSRQQKNRNKNQQQQQQQQKFQFYSSPSPSSSPPLPPPIVIAPTNSAAQQLIDSLSSPFCARTPPPHVFSNSGATSNQNRQGNSSQSNRSKISLSTPVLPPPGTKTKLGVAGDFHFLQRRPNSAQAVAVCASRQMFSSQHQEQHQQQQGKQNKITRTERDENSATRRLLDDEHGRDLDDFELTADEEIEYEAAAARAPGSGAAAAAQEKRRRLRQHLQVQSRPPVVEQETQWSHSVGKRALSTEVPSVAAQLRRRRLEESKLFGESYYSQLGGQSAARLEEIE